MTLEIHRRVLCGMLAAGDAPPTEFLIFRAGVNDSTKGPAIFDAEAATAVMAAYAAQGVHCMVDLEHESLDAPIRADSRDARGWFELELRGGDLWAVNVRWTADGARRIAERTQKYISPAFYQDDAGRVTELVNCALVAMPATHGAKPLAAARLHAQAERAKADTTAKARAAGYLFLERLKAK